jgi:hypothetical protein
VAGAAAVAGAAVAGTAVAGAAVAEAAVAGAAVAEAGAEVVLAEAGVVAVQLSHSSQQRVTNRARTVVHSGVDREYLSIKPCGKPLPLPARHTRRAR